MEAGVFTGAIRKIISDEPLAEDKIQKPAYFTYMPFALVGQL
jgi:hypothetical protein